MVEKRRPGRPEQPVDSADGPVAAFAAELRQLRKNSGSPTYQAMSRRIGHGVSPAALSAAARGYRLPSWSTVQGFARACGADPADFVGPFVRAGGTLPEPVRAAMSSRLAAPSSAADPESKSPETGERRKRRWVSHRRWRWQLAGAAVALVIAVETTAVGVMAAAGGSAGKPQATTAEPARTLLPYTWVFDPPAHATACQFHVYVPDIPQVLAAAAYELRVRRSGHNIRVGSFTIAQGAYRGKWVTRGPYPVSGRPIYLVLRDQGAAPASVAVGFVRADCS
jgi:hypothetical protein